MIPCCSLVRLLHYNILRSDLCPHSGVRTVTDSQFIKVNTTVLTLQRGDMMKLIYLH